MKKKLNEKAAKVLVKDLEEKALETVTGGTLVSPTGCRGCGLVLTTGI